MPLRDQKQQAESPAQAEPLEVLIVDDSALVRQKLKSIIESDPGFRVVLAADPYEAVAMLSKSVPADGRPHLSAQAHASASPAGGALHVPG
jgi:two-component system, chemotaxis family, protein-glutamate methylesterase/glutaminase